MTDEQNTAWGISVGDRVRYPKGATGTVVSITERGNFMVKFDEAPHPVQFRAAALERAE